MKKMHNRYSAKFYNKTLLLSLSFIIILGVLLFSVFSVMIYKNNVQYTLSSVDSENKKIAEQAKDIFDNCMQICVHFASYKNLSPIFQTDSNSDLKKATLEKEIVTFTSCFEYISGIEVITDEFTVSSGNYKIDEPVVTTQYNGFEISYTNSAKWPYLIRVKYVADSDTFNTVSLYISAVEVSRKYCNSSSYCISSGGTVLLSSDFSMLGENIKKITGKSSSELLSEDKNSGYIISSADLLTEDLKFITLVKAKDSQSFFWQQLMVLSLLFIIMILVCCLLIYMILHKIYSPIEKVVQIFKYYIPENDTLAENDIMFISECLYDKNIDEPTQKAALQMRKSQFSVLHSQISPHFLGNTLDVLKYESIEKLGLGNPIEKSLGILSMFLKETQQYLHMFSTINDEIARTKEYIKVAKFCFNEHLEVFWEIEEGLSDCFIISLTLQPLIENSIMHGFDPHSESAIIKIKMFSENGNIRIIVKDNGCGIPKNILSSIKATLCDDSITNKHIGLKNTHLKMKLLYGDNYGITNITSDSTGTSIELLMAKKHYYPNSSYKK